MERNLCFDRVVGPGNLGCRYKTVSDASRTERSHIIKVDSVLPIVILIERCLSIVFVQENFDGILFPCICAGLIKLRIANLDQNIQVFIIPQCFSDTACSLPCHLIPVNRHFGCLAPNRVNRPINYGSSKYCSCLVCLYHLRLMLFYKCNRVDYAIVSRFSLQVLVKQQRIGRSSPARVVIQSPKGNACDICGVFFE
ncbi:hypothetical protein D3C78_890330 [compost metagenome]